MSNQNAPHRVPLSELGQRRIQAVKSKGIYVLPNAFTAAALFAAFYGIIQAMNGDFGTAAVAVFFSMMFDGMDGRVARLTHTQSEFGVQMDSLADAVSFGIAPALIVYEYALVDLGKLGWATAFIYALCAILRLARFNCNVGVVSKNYFQGLPSPAAAALVCGFVWLGVENKLPEFVVEHRSWLALIVTFYAGLTMVCNAPLLLGQVLRRRTHDPLLGDRRGVAPFHRGFEQSVAFDLHPLLHLRRFGLCLSVLALLDGSSQSGAPGH